MNYEQIALSLAEKYGIIDYKVINNIMVFYEQIFENRRITYKVIIDLDNKKEILRQPEHSK